MLEKMEILMTLKHDCVRKKNLNHVAYEDICNRQKKIKIHHFCKNIEASSKKRY
jgi:hypothetical protein